MACREGIHPYADVMTLWGIRRSHVEARSVTISLPVLAVLFVVSVLLGASATWAFHRDRGVLQVVRGTVTGVNDRMTAIGFRPDGPEGRRLRGGGAGMILAGELTWRDADGNLHEGGVPPCLQPGLSYGQRVELGIIEIRPDSDSPPALTKVVVWVRCLSR